MQLRIAHVPQVPDEIAAHAEHHIPERALLPPPPELLEPAPDELLVVQVGLVDLAGQSVEHLGGAHPLLVGPGVPHRGLAEPAPARQRQPRARAGELPEEQREEHGQEEHAVGVPEVEPGGRHRHAGARERGARPRAQAPEGAEQEHAQRGAAAQQRRGADPEWPDAGLPGVLHWRSNELAPQSWSGTENLQLDFSLEFELRKERASITSGSSRK